METMTDRALSTVDDIVTADVSGRGVIDTLASAVREQQDTGPTERAAEQLAETVDSGDTVLVLTGFLIPPTYPQETDGPPGATSVARAMDRALGANPIIACEPNGVDVCEATAVAGGLRVEDREAALRSRHTVAIEEFPTDRTAAGEYAQTVVDDLDPAAVVFVEKVGANAAGVYHNSAGHDISEQSAKTDELLDRLNDVLTVAVGDGGNEVGMGVVEDAVREHVDHGRECQCPCNSGIAATEEVDVLVPATVSNWGGYAIAAALDATIRANTGALHDPETEIRMLDQCALAGGIDGIVGGTDGGCDGMPPESHAALVRLLNETISAPSF
jgi:hypothetical protein